MFRLDAKCVVQSVYDDLFVFHVISCLLQEDDMPEEVNIDDLIDLPNDEERVRRLKVTQKVCMRDLSCSLNRGSSKINNAFEEFVTEVVLQGTVMFMVYLKVMSS